MMTTTNSVGTNALSQNAFLQLMVDQMKNQDPLNPQSNSQFLAQLAQFTSLEQMTNIAQTDTKVLSALQNLQQVTEVSMVHQMLGTTVQVSTSNGQTVSGTVLAVKFNQGQPYVVVNGTDYALSDIVEMS